MKFSKKWSLVSFPHPANNYGTVWTITRQVKTKLRRIIHLLSLQNIWSIKNIRLYCKQGNSTRLTTLKFYAANSACCTKYQIRTICRTSEIRIYLFFDVILFWSVKSTVLRKKLDTYSKRFLLRRRFGKCVTSASNLQFE